MLSRILRSLVIISILAAMGCSNQAPNDASTKINNSIENETAPPATFKSLVKIEGEKAIQTTLSNRRISEIGKEVAFSVNTDQPIDGQNEFDVVLYSCEASGNRATAGFRLEDSSGRVFWMSEFSANTSDFSWLQVRRIAGEHTWSLEVETKDGVSRQTHLLDNNQLIIENPDAMPKVSKLSESIEDPSQRLNAFYAETKMPLLDNKQSDKFIYSLLTDKSLVQWVVGESSDEMGGVGPQFVGGWGRLICDVIGTISSAVCDPESSLYSASICKFLSVAKAICDVLVFIRVI